MAFLFSKCPCVLEFTDETGAEQWNVGERDFTITDDLLIYHESAEVLYETPTVMLRGTPGSVVLFPARQSAKFRVAKSGSVICIGFRQAQENVLQANLSLIETTAPARLKNRFLHFISMWEQARTVDTECAMRSEFYGILYDLQRNTAEGNRRLLHEEKIRPSVAYLERHLESRNLNLKQIAAISGVSEAYFRTLFLEQYGRTPLQYLIEMRVQKAKKLLLETDLPLHQIEFACGFQSHAYFVKQFLRIVGKTPEQVRKK